MPLVTPLEGPLRGPTRGDIDGDLVARGDRAGEKEGERADPANISADTGDRGWVETLWACLGGRQVRMGGTVTPPATIWEPPSSFKLDIS